MYQAISRASLIATALLAGFAAGCSTHLEGPEVRVEQEVVPPPLFVFLTPSHDGEVGRADDTLADDGLQIDVRVAVNDEANGTNVNEATLLVNGRWDRVFVAPVRDTVSGRIALFENVPADAATGPGHFTLTVFDPEGSNAETIIRARVARDAAPCATLTVVTGDLNVQSAYDVPFDDNTSCVSVEGDLFVYTSDLAALAPLFNVVEVGGDLIIADNGALKDVMALSALDRVGGAVRIEDNPRLDDAQIDALVAAIGNGVEGEIVVEDNG